MSAQHFSGATGPSTVLRQAQDATSGRAILMIVAALLFVACAPTAASEISAFNPDLAATALYGQYLRDSAATGTARAVQFAVDIQNAQATAANATSTAYANATDAAIAEAQMTGGRIAIALAQQAAGISERQAENLLTEWRSRGWARKDARQADAHMLTEAALHG